MFLRSSSVDVFRSEPQGRTSTEEYDLFFSDMGAGINSEQHLVVTEEQQPRTRVCLLMVLTGFLVADVDVEGEDDEQSDERRPPVDDEHDDAAEDGPRQRHPHVVVFEAGAPPCERHRLGSSASTPTPEDCRPVRSEFTWRVGEGGVEDGEVDEGVGGQEEVGDDGSDDVELS
ncbi:hypothetical protein INR49_008879 [Caranx melampygus]|nr:hypothetical protein INR49_008879 [Caranx melampygus]